MLLPSHITAPLIGCIATCSAVIFMSTLVSPLLDGPNPMGGNLPDTRAVATLAPRERAPKPGSARSSAAPQGTGTAGAAAPTRPFVLTDEPRPVPKSPVAVSPVVTDDRRRPGSSVTVPPTAVAETQGRLSGGEETTSARPDPVPLPLASKPASAVAPLPDVPTAPTGGPRWFDLRVVDVDRTETEVLVRVLVVSAGEESAVTIGLTPSSLEPVDGQAVRVSLDIVTSGADADPRLRVRLDTAADSVAAPTTPVAGEDTGSSNVVNITLPVTSARSVEAPAPEIPRPAASSELVLQIRPATTSSGQTTDGAGPDAVTVAVSVVAKPQSAAAPAAPNPKASNPKKGNKTSTDQPTDSGHAPSVAGNGPDTPTPTLTVTTPISDPVPPSNRAVETDVAVTSTPHSAEFTESLLSLDDDPAAAPSAEAPTGLPTSEKDLNVSSDAR